MGLFNGKDNASGRAATNKKTDMKLAQHGGEGKSLTKKGSDINFTPATKSGETYTGPGRNLKTESF